MHTGLRSNILNHEISLHSLSNPQSILEEWLFFRPFPLTTHPHGQRKIYEHSVLTDRLRSDRKMGYRIFSEALNRSNEPGFGSITMSILSILIMGTFLGGFLSLPLSQRDILATKQRNSLWTWALLCSSACPGNTAKQSPAVLWWTRTSISPDLTSLAVAKRGVHVKILDQRLY